MYDKIRISGEIEVISGLHIGGSSQFSAIGAVDSPVIRDTLSNHPIIPGSSLKGKMRTLLARYYSSKNKNIIKEANEDPEEIKNLFGSSQKSKGDNKVRKGRLQFRDAQLSNFEDLEAHMLDSPLEIKFENTINRLTGEANPRQIERVIRGSKFRFEIMYDAWFQGEEKVKEAIEKDFEIIKDGFQLLQLDYLGGHGSRGYGKIKFTRIEVDQVFGNSEEIDIDDLAEKLNEVIQEGAENNGV